MSRRKGNSAPMSLFSFQDIITATTGILILLALVLALSVIIQGAESEVETDFADGTQIALRNSLSTEVSELAILLKELDEESSQWKNLSPTELKAKVAQEKVKTEQLERDIADCKIAIVGQKKEYAEIGLAKKSEDLRRKLKQEEDEISAANARLKELKLTDQIVYNFRETTKAPWLLQISDKRILGCKLGSKDKPRAFHSPFEFNKFAISLPQSEHYFVLFLKPSGVDNYDVIFPYLRKQDFDIGLELIGDKQTVIDPIKGMTF